MSFDSESSHAKWRIDSPPTDVTASPSETSAWRVPAAADTPDLTQPAAGERSSASQEAAGQSEAEGADQAAGGDWQSLKDDYLSRRAARTAQSRQQILDTGRRAIARIDKQQR